LNNQFHKQQMPVGNPLMNMLVIVAGVIAAGVSLVLGFMVFVALGGIILLLGAVIAVRVWWFKRKMRGQSAAGVASGDPSENPGRAGPEVIEGEFHVVSTRKEGDSRRDT